MATGEAYYLQTLLMMQFVSQIEEVPETLLVRHSPRPIFLIATIVLVANILAQPLLATEAWQFMCLLGGST